MKRSIILIFIFILFSFNVVFADFQDGYDWLDENNENYIYEYVVKDNVSGKMFFILSDYLMYVEKSTNVLKIDGLIYRQRYYESGQLQSTDNLGSYYGGDVLTLTIEHSNVNINYDDGTLYQQFSHSEQTASDVQINFFDLHAKQNGREVYKLVYTKDNVDYVEYYEVDVDVDLNVEIIDKFGARYLVVSSYYYRMDSNGAIYNAVNDYQANPWNTFGLSFENRIFVGDTTTEPLPQKEISNPIGYIDPNHLGVKLYDVMGNELIPNKVNLLEPNVVFPTAYTGSLTLNIISEKEIVADDITLGDTANILKFKTLVSYQMPNNYYKTIVNIHVNVLGSNVRTVDIVVEDLNQNLTTSVSLGVAQNEEQIGNTFDNNDYNPDNGFDSLKASAKAIKDLFSSNETIVQILGIVNYWLPSEIVMLLGVTVTIGIIIKIVG